MGWCDRITPEDVVDAQSFILFANQQLGTPPETKTVLKQVEKLQAKWDVPWWMIIELFPLVKELRLHPDTAAHLLREMKKLTEPEI